MLKFELNDAELSMRKYLLTDVLYRNSTTIRSQLKRMLPSTLSLPMRRTIRERLRSETEHGYDLQRDGRTLAEFMDDRIRLDLMSNYRSLNGTKRSLRNDRRLKVELDMIVRTVFGRRVPPLRLDLMKLCHELRLQGYATEQFRSKPRDRLGSAIARKAVTKGLVKLQFMKPKPYPTGHHFSVITEIRDRENSQQIVYRLCRVVRTLSELRDVIRKTETIAEKPLMPNAKL